MKNIKKLDNISYFVMCHDQDIIINKYVSHYNYIFLGNGNTDKLKNFDSVIIANKLPNNIENKPKLCSFTGWYSIANNFDISNPLVLFEYDFFGDLHTNTLSCLNQQLFASVFGYKCIPCGYLMFAKSTPWLEIGLKKIYDIDLQEMFPNLPKKWISSTNVCFKDDPKIFYNFIKWFEPLANFCADKPMGGYVHERALHIFLHLYYPDSIGCIDNNITHQELRSHSQKDICDICKEMMPKDSTQSIHKCIKWLYKNLYERNKYAK